jgi:hypothetical protein
MERELFRLELLTLRTWEGGALSWLIDLLEAK